VIGRSSPYFTFGEAPAPAQVMPATTTKTVPFDYAFQFALTGRPTNKLQDVVEISMEGVFVAVAMGYSVVADESIAPPTVTPTVNQTTTPGTPVLIPLFFASAARLFGAEVAGQPGTEVSVLNVTETGDPFPAVIPLSVGQNQASTTAIALRSDGTAKATFALDFPCAVRAWDRTNSLLGQVMQASGTAGATTPVVGYHPVTRKLPAAGDTTVFVYGAPGDSVELRVMQGATGSVVFIGTKALEDVEEDGLHKGRVDFTLSPSPALAPGDLLVARTAGVIVEIDPFSIFAVPRPTLSSVTLGALDAGLRAFGADLTRGFRLNTALRGQFDADLPLDRLSAGTLERAFATGAVASEEASFLYSLDVVDTGRELQNKSIHNIAGLGIANGDRPFRPFARPFRFEPRSVIRIQIEELSTTPGTLFIVLHGYKVLGASRTLR